MSAVRGDCARARVCRGVSGQRRSPSWRGGWSRKAPASWAGPGGVGSRRVPLAPPAPPS
ncbi:Hypothetical protein EPM1_2166 [Stenotrophomonas maltophilia EPM1]|nr:Hypothetical protein EPM1_2166 [Stenotrophomonas maltophilia EPM1]